MTEIENIVSDAKQNDWRERQNTQKKIAYETISKKTEDILKCPLMM